MKRDNALDFYRGLTMINIVLLHAAWSADIKELIFLTMMVDAPMFFFLSGWSSNYSHRLPKVMGRIIRMWILWAIVVLLCDVVSFILTGQRDHLATYLRAIFFAGKTVDTFKRLGDTGWFMYVYIAVIPVITIVVNFMEKELYAFREFIIVVISLIAGVFYLTLYEDKVYFFIPRRVMFYSIFFLIGYVFAKFRVKITWGKAFILIGSCIILWWFTARITKTNLWDVQSYKFVIPSAVYLFYSLVFVLIVCALYSHGMGFRKSQLGIYQAICFIGRNSICFYLAQAIGDQVISYVFQTTRLAGINLFVIEAIVSFIVTLIVAVVFYGIYNAIGMVWEKIAVVLEGLALNE